METALEPWNERCPIEPIPVTDRLAVIVPVYNEERTVAELLRRLEVQPCVSQIIIVDDGSTDRTFEELEPWRDCAANSADSSEDVRSIIVLRHEKNRGKGRAIRTGLEYVDCSHVIIQDADLEYDPADINQLWAIMQSGLYDVVLGSRYLGQSRLQRGRWVFQSGVRLLNRLTWMVYGVHLTDQATCYKMLQTAQLRRLQLNSSGFNFCTELICKAAGLKLTMTECPVRYRARTRREGKKLRLRDGVQAVIMILWHRRTPRLMSHRFSG